MDRKTVLGVAVRMTSVACLVALMASAQVMAASGDEKPLPTVKKQPNIAAHVPSAIRGKGSITIVMTTSSPPAHFTTSSGMEGLDHDLAISIAKVLGLKPKVVGVPIDQVIPGLQAHRYDVVVSQFKPTTARGKVLDFIDYAQSGTSLGVLRGNPKKLGPKNLCGAMIGVQKGSSQAVGMVPDLSKKCAKEGHKPIQKKTFRDSTTALLALRSRRVDGVLIDSPVMGYAAEQSNQVAIAGTLKSNPVGIGVLKNSGLAKPIQRALQYLKKSGAYNKIFKNWGMSRNEISDFAINHLQAD
jgi:polar amino acid transport system substrate-binding protein